MQRFNIAYVPQNPDFQKQLCELAQTHYAHKEDGYLLSSKALAHVTLCQFDAASEEEAKAAFSSAPNKEDEKLRGIGFRFRKGTAKNEGFFWAEILYEKKPSLVQRQKNVSALLTQRGFKTLTPIETYSPHVTLARLPKELLPIENSLFNEEIIFRLTIGSSTDTGVLLREL